MEEIISYEVESLFYLWCAFLAACGFVPGGGPLYADRRLSFVPDRKLRLCENPAEMPPPPSIFIEATYRHKQSLFTPHKVH